jgi:hypothetical protein
VLTLVDRTDNLTEPQRAELDRFIQEVSLDQNNLVDLPRYGKLSLYSFETNASAQPQLDLLFAYCKPPSASDANELYETPFVLQRAYEETFGQSLLEQTAGLTEPNTSPRSYILDSIALTLADQRYPQRTPPRTLIIFSDMMENTPSLSHYIRSSAFDLNAMQLLQEQPEIADAIDLSEVNVSIIYLPRANARAFQGVQHQAFWRDLLFALGAKNVTIRGVSE